MVDFSINGTPRRPSRTQSMPASPLVGSLLLTLLLVGCSGIELSPVTPAGIDFSGEWVIDFGDSDGAPDLRKRPQRKANRNAQPSVRGEARRVGGGTGLSFITHDFQVLGADKVQIEQNRDSMGIRYFPGVYRDVTWGERQRGLWEVYAGWEGKNLMIQSKAKDLSVLERFVRLAPNRMVVYISIVADGEKMEFRRTFTRRS